MTLGEFVGWLDTALGKQSLVFEIDDSRNGMLLLVAVRGGIAPEIRARIEEKIPVGIDFRIAAIDAVRWDQADAMHRLGCAVAAYEHVR